MRSLEEAKAPMEKIYGTIKACLTIKVEFFSYICWRAGAVITY
jgi:hypothetical protein